MVYTKSSVILMVLASLFCLDVIAAESDLYRSDLRYASAIHGSENHEIMRISNILMTAQALKDLPEYKDRRLVNGETLKHCYDRWNSFYKHRWDEMASHALLVEAFANYGKYTMPEIVNMFDFAEDPELKGKTKMILHAIWTEWAIGQLNGVRGGGRVRLYQGAENAFGENDMWRQMSLFFFDMGPWGTSWHPDPIIGFPRVLASTRYRVPKVVMDIAKDANGRGEYVYVGKRLARQSPIAAEDVPVWWSPWYNLDAVDTRMLAYDYCTPDFIMGALMLDPTLSRVGSDEYLEGNTLQEGYPALTSQNLYTRIVFATGYDAGVVPQCLPAPESNDKTYLQYQSVQHKNILLIQRHQKSSNATLMRIFFSTGMKDRLIEQEGWLILQEGAAYLAAKGFSSADGQNACGYTWNDECWLHLDDKDALAVFVLGRKEKYPDLDAFASYVLTGISSLVGQRFSFSIADANDESAELSLFLDAENVPLVNGKEINFMPDYVFDSPFFRSRHASGVIKIRKGSRELILDFNRNITVGINE